MEKRFYKIFEDLHKIFFKILQISLIILTLNLQYIKYYTNYEIFQLNV